MLMLALKIIFYIPTSVCALFFGFREMQIRRQLIGKFIEPFEQTENTSYFVNLNDVGEDIRHENLLRRLPSEVTHRLKVVRTIKILSFVAFIVEVLILQGLDGPVGPR